MSLVRSSPYAEIRDDVRIAVQEILAGADDYHVSHTARLARTTELLCENATKEKEIRILELGTSGFFPLVCEKLLPNASVTATHYSSEEQRSEQVEFRVGSKKVSVYCHLLDLEYSQIPEEDETFDIILCCEVLEHMEIDPMFMLSELNRVAKSGAILLLTTPNILSSRAFHKMMNGYAPYFYMQYHRTREYNRHNYEYGLRELHDVLKSAGFIGTIQTEDLFDDPVPSVIEKLHAGGFYVGNYGDNLVAVVRKTFDVINRYPASIYV